MSGAELRAFVVRRAGDRCEYCRMHQSLQGATFHLEHVRPRSRGGETAADNLALACPQCNLHKADRVQAADPADGRFVPLFDPRRHWWADHFRWEEGRTIAGLSAVGRAAVAALDASASTATAGSACGRRKNASACSRRAMTEDAPQRVHPLREVFDAVRYVVRSGCPWRMLPHDFPPWEAVYQQARRWQAAGAFEQIAHELRIAERTLKDRPENPTATALDGRTLRSTPESGHRASYDGYKRTNGSKVHVAVDTLGK